jgi:hypothetical protein
MEAWYCEDPTRYDAQERMIERKTDSKDLARMWSLYRYLQRFPPTSAQDLKSRVFLDKEGTPLFDDETAHEVYAIWSSLKDPVKYGEEVMKYTRKRLEKHGGGEGDVNEEFLDKVFIKIYSLIRGPIASILTSVGLDPMQDTTLGYASRAAYNTSDLLQKIIFFLHTLESNPNLGGPLWTLMLDALTKNTPRIIAALEGPITTLNAMLVVVWGIGAASEVITSIITAVVAVSIALINLSRRKFGSAFSLMLLGIPVIGPVFTMSIASMEQVYSDFKNKQAKLQEIPLIGSFFAWDPLEGGFRRTYRRKINGRRKTSRKSKAVDRARRRGAAYSESSQGNSQ